MFSSCLSLVKSPFSFIEGKNIILEPAGTAWQAILLKGGVQRCCCRCLEEQGNSNLLHKTDRSREAGLFCVLRPGKHLKPYVFCRGNGFCAILWTGDKALRDRGGLVPFLYRTVYKQDAPITHLVFRYLPLTGILAFRLYSCESHSPCWQEAKTSRKQNSRPCSC